MKKLFIGTLLFITSLAILLISLVILGSCTSPSRPQHRVSLTKSKKLQTIIKSTNTKTSKLIGHINNDFQLQYSPLADSKLITEDPITGTIESIKLRLTFPKLSKSSVLFIVGHPLS